MTSPPSSPRTALIVALLLALTALVFAPGAGGDFVWDDVPLVQTNAALRDLGALVTSLVRPFWSDALVLDEVGSALATYYRPVVTLAYGVQYQLFGGDPLGYHLVNIALHAACVLLAYFWLVRRLTRWLRSSAGQGDAGMPTVRAAAAIGAALFAVHPSRPESVTWISGCTDLWMTLWLLCAVTAWDRCRGVVRWLLVGAAFLLAVFSKEPAILLPLLLLADAVLAPANDGEDRRRARRALVGLFVLGAALFAVRHALSPPMVRDPLGEGALDLGQRVLSSAGHYAWMMFAFWPPTVQAGLRLFGPDGAAMYPAWSLVVGVLSIVVVVALAVVAVRRRCARPWLADVSWIAVPLLLVLNVFPLNMNVLVAARFLYLPVLGLAALWSRALVWAMPRGGATRVVALGVSGAAVVACGFVTLQQIPTLLDTESLWRYEHALEPRNVLAARSFAGVLRTTGKNDEALDVLRRTHALPTTARLARVQDEMALEAVEISMRGAPDRDRQTLLGIARFYDDLATRGRATLSVRGLRIAISPALAATAELLSKPSIFRLPRALVALRLRRHEDAESQLRALVRDLPHHLEAWGNLVIALARQDKLDEALRAADRGLALRPNNRLLLSARPTLSSALAAKERAGPGAPPSAVAERVTWLLELGGIEGARAIVEGQLRLSAADPALRVLRERVEARAAELGL